MKFGENGVVQKRRHATMAGIESVAATRCEMVSGSFMAMTGH